MSWPGLNSPGPQPLLSVDSVWSIHPLQILLWGDESGRTLASDWTSCTILASHWPKCWEAEPERSDTIFFRFSDINIRSLNSDKNFFGHVLLSQQNREDDGLQHFLQAFTALLLDTAHMISVIDITQSHKQVWQLAAEYTVTVSEFLLFLCTNLFKLIKRGCVIYKYLSSNLG